MDAVGVAVCVLVTVGVVVGVTDIGVVVGVRVVVGVGVTQALSQGVLALTQVIQFVVSPIPHSLSNV